MSFLEERARAKSGKVGTEPDTLFEIEREATTSYTSPLYPEYRRCPHLGCYWCALESPAESLSHESRFHMAERKQRLSDKLRTSKGQPLLPRTHKCPVCPASFSSAAFKKSHCQSHNHHSKSAATKLARAQERKNHITPPPPACT